jgi:hypothetical protein
MCVLAALLVSLQFIVYGCHRIALGLAWMLRGVWLGALYVSRRTRTFFVRAAAAQGEGHTGPPTAQVVARPISARVRPERSKTTA